MPVQGTFTKVMQHRKLCGCFTSASISCLVPTEILSVVEPAVDDTDEGGNGFEIWATFSCFFCPETETGDEGGEEAEDGRPRLWLEAFTWTWIGW